MRPVILSKFRHIFLIFYSKIFQNSHTDERFLSNMCVINFTANFKFENRPIIFFFYLDAKSCNKRAVFSLHLRVVYKKKKKRKKKAKPANVICHFRSSTKWVNFSDVTFRWISKIIFKDLIFLDSLSTPALHIFFDRF